MLYLLRKARAAGLVTFFLLSAIHQFAQNSTRIAEVFSDHMVLQRDKPVPVWGTAAPGEKIILRFQQQKLITRADSNGRWMVTLAPLSVSTKPDRLLVKGKQRLSLEDILVGDVWLCSGQSNMEYPMDRLWKKYAGPARGTDRSAEALQNPDQPAGVRLLYVERTLNKRPYLPVKGWTLPADTMTRFVSAIGYHFAEDIYKSTGIPIGIISSSWGGTRIDQWIPPAAYKNSVFKDSVTSDTFRIDGIRPGQMFEGMIKPLLPFACKGILWYQGESDLMIHDQDNYRERFELWLRTWRSLLRDENLPVYFVQIAPYFYSKRKDKLAHTPDLLPQFWEAQTRCLDFPNTGMVVTTDLVDQLSDIHPSYKWIVADRLALWAKSKLYGFSSVEYSGPRYESMQIKEDSIIIRFSHAAGLTTSDGKEPGWWEIAGENGSFVQAKALIREDRLVLFAPGLSKPASARFAWHETARPNLMNGAGLPAVPFRTTNRY